MSIAVISVGEQGPPGIQGPPGAGGASISVNFAFGDATPKLLGTAPAGKNVREVLLFIDEGFNGVGASLAIGPTAAPGELMATTENDPAMVSSYETFPGKRYVASTQLYLTITPGAGASQGKGQVILDIES